MTSNAFLPPGVYPSTDGKPVVFKYVSFQKKTSKDVSVSFDTYRPVNLSERHAATARSSHLELGQVSGRLAGRQARYFKSSSRDEKRAH